MKIEYTDFNKTIISKIRRLFGLSLSKYYNLINQNKNGWLRTKYCEKFQKRSSGMEGHDADGRGRVKQSEDVGDDQGHQVQVLHHGQQDRADQEGRWT